MLIRHLTGDPPDAAACATARLAEEDRLLLTDLVLAECVYVLESVYGLDRSSITVAMRSALALPSIAVIDEQLLLRSLEIYEVHEVDFAEAYLAACAESTGVNAVCSFDRDIDRIPTVDRIAP